MKKFLVLAVGILMFLAADAAPVYNVDRQQTDQTLLVQQSDCHQMVVDFSFVDHFTFEIMSTTGTEYVSYTISPAEVRIQVFDLTTPYYRLCSHRANMFKSNLYTFWRGLNSHPLSQYDRA